MAWTCSGNTNGQLIDNLLREGLIQSSRVADAMKKVDRRHYVLDNQDPYKDTPQSIGFGATISAPHMHAHACENLLPYMPKEGERGAVLDVGSGSGYLAAVLHHISPSASIVGIDHLSGLVDLGKANLAKDGIELGDKEGGVQVVLGDGRKGYTPCAPYKVIHVGAAAPTIPQDLIDQLDRPGRMFIPVGEHNQDIWQVDKAADGSVNKTKLFGVRYVPLTDAHKQWRS